MKRIGVVLLAAALSAGGASAAPAAKAQKVRTVEGITEYRLPNGMQVLLFPDDSQSTVTVNVTYLVGSRMEGYGETGMAHLLEHMMFKGSPRHRNVLKLVSEKGGQLNGSTWTDRTNYFETLPASQENLDWTLDLESDRMINAEVSPDDLKTEFSVVRNEFEGGENDPGGVLDERIASTAYLWHNYGKSTIGSRADIEKVQAPTLRRFYTKYYQPDNAVLIVSGKFDQTKALASIEKTFGAIAKPTRVLEPTYTTEPAQDGERTVTLRRAGDVAIVGLAYHTVSGGTTDHAAIEAADDILTHEAAGRLYKKLVETKLATSISGGDRAQHDPGLSQFYAEVRDPKNVDKVTQIMETEIEGLGNAKLDQKELDRWKVATLKQIELASTNSQGMAIRLSESIAIGDWRTWFAHRDAVTNVKLEDVTRVAKMYFKASNRTLGQFLPIKGQIERAPLTETASVADYVKTVKEGTTQDNGEVFNATLENIEARTKRVDLKSGFKAAFLAKKTRGGKVAMQITLHWGDDKSLQNKVRPAWVMAQLMMRGTTKHSYQDLKDTMDKLKARITMNDAAHDFTIGIETTRDNLVPSLELVGEMLTQPAFSDKELELVKQQSLAQLEQAKQDPQQIANDELEHAMTKWPKSDPRYPFSTDEQIELIKGITSSEIRQYYKDFAGAGHGELAVVGDFDQAAVTASVDKIFGAWQTKKPYKRLDAKPWNNPGAEKSILVKDKEQTTFLWGFDLPMRDTDPDYPAWIVANNVLGGYGGSRLWMRVREHEGLSYGVYSWFQAGSLDDRAIFGGTAIVAPQNLAKAKASIMDELKKLSTGAATPDELQKAKDAWLKQLDTGLSDDRYEVAMLLRQEERNRTTEFTKQLKAKVSAVTAADVQRVAQKYLDPKRLVLIDAGDSSKAAAAGVPAAK
ncbi:MAG: pitrilysin family protein [Kofleriaceae bacterium]